MLDEISIVKKELAQAISQLCEVSWMFVKDPKRDFTKKRKLPFNKVVSLLLAMEGGTLTTELLKYFGYSPNIATSSAFVQQRGKIHPSAFSSLFELFVQKTNKEQYYKGFRLLAADGSVIFRFPPIQTIQIPIFPQKRGNPHTICSILTQCTICFVIPIPMQFCSDKEKQMSEALFVIWLTVPL